MAEILKQNEFSKQRRNNLKKQFELQIDNKMFTVQALYPFSSLTMKSQQQKQQNEQNSKYKDHSVKNEEQTQKKIGNQEQNEKQEQEKPQKGKRQRSESQERQLYNAHDNQNQKQQQNQEQAEIEYLSFEKGNKILVMEAYENGWWYGYVLGKPEVKGYFPSNYTKKLTSNKPPPPPPPPSDSQQNSEQMAVYDPNNQQPVNLIPDDLRTIEQGPIQSSYYAGIKGYKNVKIDEKNQNILKGQHVKFDVNTGIARVPIKDQAPAAKSVRQMGYYFDYHQWTEERNKNPQQKARPDIRKKKAKTLKLKGMN